MPLLSLPRAITFDVGGTLIQPWPSVGHVYADVADECGYGKIAPERLNAQFARAWKVRRHFDYSRKAWLGLVTETFAGSISEPITESFFDALYRRFEQPDAWRIFDDVLPVLEELKRCGIRLAVISNWDERLRPLLRALALESFFETLVISHEIGHPKPAVEIFHRAARMMQLPAESILHVGDSREEDFQGAQAAGCASVFLNRAGKTASKNEIRSLKELSF